MPSEAVVHSTTKRFFQIVGIAILMAAALTGLKHLAQREPESGPAAIVEVTPPVSPDADLLVGRSSVIDGDTIEIHGTRVRLDGIDAPEVRQWCGGQGREWSCGQEAALALSDWIADRPVSCRLRGTDRYQRSLARCFVDNDDMQAWLVSNGWALAYRSYSEDYVAAEEYAAATRAGMWRDEFVPPQDWRRSR